MRTWRIGTRATALAGRQCDLAIGALEAVMPDVRFEIVVIGTAGDDVAGVPTWRPSGPGAFTASLSRAVADGTIDLAVHSLKDLPVHQSPATTVAAVLRRDDPRDVLVDRYGRLLLDLPPGATVGTSSLRRRALLLAGRPDVVPAPIRGSVPARLDQVEAGRVDAVILALAGLRRLHRVPASADVLSPDVWLPAPGQAAIAIEARVADDDRRRRLEAINDAPTWIATTAERALLAALGAGCHAPVGALAWRESPSTWRLEAVVADVDGTRVLRAEATGPVRHDADGRALAAQVADRLVAQGALALIEKGREAAHAG